MHRVFRQVATFRAALLCCAVLVPLAARAQQADSIAALRSGFQNPPAAAKLRCYWWWLNGNTTEATITHDLEQMKAKGFGGALLVDANGASQNGNAPVPAGPTFGSAAWRQLYLHALQEADRLQLEITLNITSGWNLGGPDVSPADASKLLTWTRTPLVGGKHVRIALNAPAAKNGFYRQIAVLAYPLKHGAALALNPEDGQGDRHTGRNSALAARSAAVETGFSMPDSSRMLQPGSDPDYADSPRTAVVDITSRVAPDGTLEWDAPPGEWEVLRIGYTDSDARISTSSGAWQGLALDYLDNHALRAYWGRNVAPLLDAAKPFHSLVGIATDSWELGGTNWTGRFQQEFQRRRGYDPVPWLPVVAGRVLDNRDASTRFLTDLRRTVADLIVEEHYDVLATLAGEYGLGVQAESGGPHGAPIDALETFRKSAVPQTEFWSINGHRRTDEERFFTKEASSAAHIYGQRWIAQEGETSIGPQWSESLREDLKPSFDMAITEGMNRLVWHEFTSSPADTGLPGQEYFAGTHLNPKVTWWNAGDAFFAYLNRVQYVMQQGTPVSDVLYFYGDHVPNFVRLKADDPAKVLPGYDYDVTNQDALLHSIHASGAMLQGPGGVQWRLLAVPKTRRLSEQALAFVRDYVRGGGAVVGEVPTSTTGQIGPAEQHAFEELVREIWGDRCENGSQHPYGKGQVFCETDAHDALQKMHVPLDAEVVTGNAGKPATFTSAFDYIHRRLGRDDVYFIRNGSSAVHNYTVALRAQAGTPQIWDAVTGESSTPVHLSLPDGRTAVDLALPPFGSVVVVFSATNSAPTHIAAPPQTVPLQALGWTMTFQPQLEGPTMPVPVPEFRSWTDSTIPGIRYFSGTATYRATVFAPAAKGKAVWLRFTDVREIARVRINGNDAGTVWAFPLQLRVDRYLKAGKNQVEIEVTNLWPNRIIGDLQPGVTHPVTQTNIRAYTAGSPLLDSGILGPLTWQIADK